MQDLIEKLFGLMQDGICRTELSGICEVTLDDNGDRVTAFIELNDNELKCTEAATQKPDVVVIMKQETLARVLNNLDRFDLRDPNFLMQVSVEGNLALAGYLFNLIKRPSEKVYGLIRDTEEKCQDYKDSVTEIRRIHKPSKEEVLSLIDESMPFVMTGVLDDWEFLSSSLEEIKKKFGDTRLRPVLEKGKEGFETMGDFIEKVERSTGDIVYTGGCDLPPAMWSKFRLPFFSPETFTTPQIWMGSKSGDNPCTALHRDCCNGMLANIFGRKKMILFSPEQTEYLYALKAFNTFQTCEIKNVIGVDTDEFPAFAKAHALEVIVGPGELLVIPAFWWHCVYAVDNVFSVSAGMQWDAWEELKPGNETVSLTI